MSDGDVEKEMGNVAFRRGDYATALKHYDKAIENAGYNATAVLFSNKAAALFKLEKYDRCVHECSSALIAPGLTPELKLKVQRRLRSAYELQVKLEQSLDPLGRSEFRDMMAGLSLMGDLERSGYALKVDNLAQPVKIEQRDSRSNGGDAGSWESLQKHGNELFVTGQYELAIAAYTVAIELKRKVAPEKELADLLANKAAAYLAFEKPLDAFWECQSALFVAPDHLKATMRLAKAQAKLKKYEEARDVLANSPHTTTTPAFQTELSRMNRFCREQQHGEYDLKSLIKEASASQTPRLDHAEYNGGVEVKWISEERGNGLVALRDFAPSELLFVSKAFDLAYRSECNDTRVLVEGGSMPFLHDLSRRECITRICRQIGKNKDLVKELYRLYAGPDFKRFEELDDEEAPAFDALRVVKIVSFNGVGFSEIKDGSLSGDDATPGFNTVRYGFVFGGCGVWILASFMNHSCVPNTVSFFVGDLMFVRARKKVSKGEEVTSSYFAGVPEYGQRRETLTRLFGFECECEMCACDLKRAADLTFLEHKRKAFMASFDAKLDHWMDGSTESLSKILEEHRSLAEDFLLRLAKKGCYDRCLEKIYATLAIGYHTQRSWLKAAKAYEMAYAAVVGNGTETEDSFICNPLTSDAFYFCFNIAHNYLCARDFAKAKEYLGKMQQAAKICWGSADEELLQMINPDLSLKDLFESLRMR